MLPSLTNLSFDNRLDISAGKRKGPSENDPAAAGGISDEDYQRMQSYYVCAQERDPVLFVVKNWFAGRNRYAFDAMQRAAGLQLNLKTNDFYPLCSTNKVQFETTLDWYQAYFQKMNAFLQTRNPASLFPIPIQMATVMFAKTKVSTETFVSSLAPALNAAFPADAPEQRQVPLTTMGKHRVPAQPDSMVFFTGPHMVDSTPVRRLVCYVHSLSENTATDILRNFPSYTSSVESMKIPPNAQGKQRSNLVDVYLKDHFNGDWGWTRKPGLLFDQASIEEAPIVAPPNREMVDTIRQSFLNDSCYVATNVLAGNPAAGFSAFDFEAYILNCIAIVIDRGLKEQEALKSDLMAWIVTYPGGIGALLLHPEDPSTPHEKVLKDRLKLGNTENTELMTPRVRDYAMSTMLRSTRKPTSASWETFDGNPFTWPDEGVPEGKKVIRSKSELKSLCREVSPELLQQSVADGPLARLDGDMNNPKDLWQLVRNIGGLKSAAELRRRLFLAGQIAHPHIGHWVSAMKPWNPPLTNPVGNWQNVYMLLTLGMFDSHYMPRHDALRSALRPIIEQVWHASSRRPFKKVLFAPERFNIRELPRGGQPLPWHIDQDAIAPACSSNDSPGFLQDA